MSIVIDVYNVTKLFKVNKNRPATLKERAVKRGENFTSEFCALKNVSFQVEKGQTVALVGKNGCGKSTLLKLINRTMFPSDGEIEVKGRVSSLIELGAGFHPELTGRENIYTNAAIFGLDRSQIDSRMDAIISFSELSEHIDYPVRTYSSGMYARLAFSVAIHVDAEVLLIDEILGVGDVNFQAKCASRIFELKNKGITILLVTHDMAMVDKLCDYAVWLNHGVVQAQGSSKEIQKKYLEFMYEERDNSNKKESKSQDPLANEQVAALGIHQGNGDIIFTSMKLFNHERIPKTVFNTEDGLCLEVEYKCRVCPDKIYPNLGFELSKIDGQYVFGTNTAREGFTNLKFKSEGVLSIILPRLQLLPGEYSIGVAIDSVDETISYDHYQDIVHFRVISEISDIGVFRMQHQYSVDGEVLK